MKRVECESLAALSAAAASFLERLPSFSDRATVVGLSGDLGAGKTAFVKALAEHLGITEHVTSPTFVLQKTYPISVPHSPFPVPKFSSLTHVDAYRLESADELQKIGWKETCASPRTLVAIEWPEQVPGAMPPDAVQLRFEWVSDGTRAITFPDL
ncbi:MAG: tRNA (adenosine(37)-N6)-threonylcarbamoyltransferase complex ATPase subunit type 1 TsaE [Candidatus Campbellbacteria bacterium]